MKDYKEVGKIVNDIKNVLNTVYNVDYVQYNNIKETHDTKNGVDHL